MRNISYNFIDLFSGCGGISCGLEMAGHKCLLGVDFQPDAVKSFQRNHPKAYGLCMDIHQLNEKKLSEYIDINSVDMVVGGPPCQGFSTVGRGDSSDQRNSLFKQFVRVVKITNPKIIIFENVTGILAKKNAKTLKRIFSSFERLGYHMDAQVMSSEVYGVPSRRRRTIIMGVKNGVPAFPIPTHGAQTKRPLVSVQETFKNLAASCGTIFNHDPAAAKVANELDRKRLGFIPPGKGIRYQRDEKEFLPKRLRYKIDWKTIREGRFRQTRLQRIALDSVAPTILTSRTMYYHPTEPRFLTCREAAACQSFPNDFVFEGSQTSVFRQIGNAVPPALAYALGKEIKKIKFEGSVKFKRSQVEDFKKKAFTYREEVYA